MGRWAQTVYAARQDLNETIAREEQARAAQDRRRAEDQRLLLSNYLGSDEQVSGGGSFTSGAPLEFQRRYSLDEDVLGSSESLFAATTPEIRARMLEQDSGYNAAYGVSTTQWDNETQSYVTKPHDTLRPIVEGKLNRANELLEQAERFAAGGDLAQATQLRQQAEEVIGSYQGGSFGHATAEQMFRLNDPSADAQARAKLSSKTAQTVGSFVKQGREFMDPESETSRDFKSNLIDPARRQINRAERATQRRTLDLARSRGGARNIAAEQAVTARARESFGAARADVVSHANQYFETFSRDFAAKSVALSQAFIDDQPGVRDEYLNAMQSIRFAGSEYANVIAQREYAALVRDASQADEGTSGIGAVIGGVLGAVIGTYAGGQTALGASLGASAGDAVESLF